MRRITVLLGIPIDEVTLVQALDRIEEIIRQPGPVRQVATANTDFIVNALADPALRQILLQADLVTADGMPVVWAARFLGGRVPERVAGADLVPALAGRCAQKGYSLFLLGARPDIALGAAQRLQERFPSLRIGGVFSPPISGLAAMNHGEILQRVNAVKPDVLLVALGNPKQEQWIHMHRHALRARVAVGIGGTLDLIAGRLRRSPVWIQHSGMEWMWRLSQEPRRLWRRYLLDFTRFGPTLVRHWLGMRSTSGDGTALPASEGISLMKNGRLAVCGPFGAAQRIVFEAVAARAMRPGLPVRVDLRYCSRIDGAGLGCLLALAAHAREVGADLRPINAPRHIREVVRSAKLESILPLEDALEEQEVFP